MSAPDLPGSGGPAFPLAGNVGRDAEPGMSLRDWFAGQALAAPAATWTIPDDGPARVQALRDLARAAYDCADAMLAERERYR